MVVASAKSFFFSFFFWAKYSSKFCSFNINSLIYVLCWIRICQLAYYHYILIIHYLRFTKMLFILNAFQTRELIEDLRSASGLEMQGSRSKLGADTKTLLRILCHRGDSEASQFLKKQYKIPKSSAQFISLQNPF